MSKGLHRGDMAALGRLARGEGRVQRATRQRLYEAGLVIVVQREREVTYRNGGFGAAYHVRTERTFEVQLTEAGRAALLGPQTGRKICRRC